MGKHSISSRRKLLVPVSILAMLISLGLITHALRFPLNHDVGWYLHVASRMLADEALYSSIIEVNPPLYAYLMTIPIAVAAMTNVAAPNAAIALAVGICTASVALSTWLAMGATRARVAGPLFGLVAGAALLGLPGVELGQREHLMFALIIPFLLLYACRTLERQVSPQMAVLAGLAAGLGLAFKPHFVLMWLGFEAVLGFMRADPGPRRKRPEVRCIALVLATYASLVAVFHHQYFTLMWRARNLYSAFAAAELADMLFTTHSILVATVLASYAVTRDDRNGLRKVSLPFVSFAVVAWLAAIIQGKGWSYHFFPALAASAIAGLLPDVVLVDTAPSDRFGGRTFPYITYLSRDPRFVSLWDDYSLAARSGRYAVYSVSGGSDRATAPAPKDQRGL